jgi:hypothetical protein
MKTDGRQRPSKPHSKISECLRAQLNTRRAHRPAHSIGSPGGSTSTSEVSARPPAPFFLTVVSDTFEHFQPVILININNRRL